MPHALERLAAPACLTLLLVLTGCATLGAPDREALEAFPEAVQVEAVPFYPQTELHCGPAALATVLDHGGVAVDYSELVDRVYLPERGGTLQVELLGAARSSNRIPWVLNPDLSELLQELQAGRPVLVLENQGLRRVPYWHYAVVIGFDPQQREVIQHSGTEETLHRPLRRWLREWSLAGRWAVVTLPPDALPVTPERERWLQTVADFEAVAEPEAALAAWQTAADRWPDAAMAWLGQGNSYYRLGQLNLALKAFEKALQQNPEQAAAAFNRASVLLEVDQPCAASTQLEALIEHPALGERAQQVLVTARAACANSPQARKNSP